MIFRTQEPDPDRTEKKKKKKVQQDWYSFLPAEIPAESGAHLPQRYKDQDPYLERSDSDEDKHSRLKSAAARKRQRNSGDTQKGQGVEQALETVSSSRTQNTGGQRQTVVKGAAVHDAAGEDVGAFGMFDRTVESEGGQAQTRSQTRSADKVSGSAKNDAGTGPVNQTTAQSIERRERKMPERLTLMSLSALGQNLTPTQILLR